MSCRWVRRTAPVSRRADDAEATYADLVRSGRKGDFYWLARSQGLTPEDADRLWDRLQRSRRQTRREPD